MEDLEQVKPGSGSPGLSLSAESARIAERPPIAPGLGSNPDATRSGDKTNAPRDLGVDGSNRLTDSALKDYLDTTIAAFKKLLQNPEHFLGQLSLPALSLIDGGIVIAGGPIDQMLADRVNPSGERDEPRTPKALLPGDVARVELAKVHTKAAKPAAHDSDGRKSFMPQAATIAAKTTEPTADDSDGWTSYKTQDTTIAAAKTTEPTADDSDGWTSYRTQDTTIAAKTAEPTADDSDGWTSYKTQDTTIAARTSQAATEVPHSGGSAESRDRAAAPPSSNNSLLSEANVNNPRDLTAASWGAPPIAPNKERLGGDTNFSSSNYLGQIASVDQPTNPDSPGFKPSVAIAENAKPASTAISPTPWGAPAIGPNKERLGGDTNFSSTQDLGRIASIDQPTNPNSPGFKPSVAIAENAKPGSTAPPPTPWAAPAMAPNKQLVVHDTDLSSSPNLGLVAHVDQTTKAALGTQFASTPNNDALFARSSPAWSNSDLSNSNSSNTSNSLASKEQTEQQVTAAASDSRTGQPGLTGNSTIAQSTNETKAVVGDRQLASLPTTTTPLSPPDQTTIPTSPKAGALSGDGTLLSKTNVPPGVDNHQSDSPSAQRFTPTTNPFLFLNPSPLLRPDTQSEQAIVSRPPSDLSKPVQTPADSQFATTPSLMRSMVFGRSFLDTDRIVDALIRMQQIQDGAIHPRGESFVVTSKMPAIQPDALQIGKVLADNGIRIVKDLSPGMPIGAPLDGDAGKRLGPKTGVKLPGSEEFDDGAEATTKKVKSPISNVGPGVTIITSGIRGGDKLDEFEDGPDDASTTKATGSGKIDPSLGGLPVSGVATTGNVDPTQTGNTQDPTNGPVIAAGSTDPQVATAMTLPDLEIFDPSAPPNGSSRIETDSAGAVAYSENDIATAAEAPIAGDRREVSDELDIQDESMNDRNDVNDQLVTSNTASSPEDAASDNDQAYNLDENVQGMLGAIFLTDLDSNSSEKRIVRTLEDMLGDFKHEKYVVLPGDTVESIALRKLKDARLAQLLYNINEKALGKINSFKTTKLKAGVSIELPHFAEILRFKLHVLKDPAAMFSYAKQQVASETAATVINADKRMQYTCRLGDSLPSIAKRYFQSASLWKLIALTNKLSTKVDAIGAPLAKLKRGLIIELPSQNEIASFISRRDENKRQSTALAAQKQENLNGPVDMRVISQNDLGDGNDSLLLRLELKHNDSWLPVVEYSVNEKFSGLKLYDASGLRKRVKINLPTRAARELAENDIAANSKHYCAKFLSAALPS